jgi:predicted nuclease with TOPRIM domain
MWNWAIWGALILAMPAGIGALALLAVRSLQAWRDVKKSRRDIVRRLGDLQAKGEATAHKVAAAGDSAEVQESLDRLQVSLARLAVLRAALDDAQVTFGRVTALVPRK